MLRLSINDPEELIKVAHALSSEIRVDMLKLLNERNMNVIELAKALQIPVSTAATNVKVLENAKLILTELQPASRGAMKVCSRNFDDVHMILRPLDSPPQIECYRMEMPIGHFSDCHVIPTCGMADEESFLSEDDPLQFLYPERVKAQLLWFRTGYVEYKFPLSLPPTAEIRSIQFTMELCSEAPNYDNDWPSDMTMWVNGIEVGTWRSPGDFGDRRGKLNPAWWSDTCTQYGLLKTWKIDGSKTLIDNTEISKVTVRDLGLLNSHYVTMRIGIKPDAIHKGGINLFGKKFGDYEQDILIEVYYST
ncbi:ArsR/SmtB family transcription factor [Lihuaxuella thermophila]|uniref:Predicted transcriptional regulator n=1 Tax=Lihuaxuella thermophila TaxID=1173111 RepID=A0A1H8AJ42_9BACL|nr:ArsR family transcriptional regulator [Lihuaxuella thermophila]SEM70641.1 Predicted transcriptional regulator [Lihuaxuella thermophila]